jgi:ankyrin repeat protein
VKWDPVKRAPANITGSKKHDLWECCREGDVPALVNLIQSLKAESANDNAGNDAKLSEILNSQDQEGKTPLMMAVDTSIVETVDALLTHGGTVIDVNKGNTQLETPLHVACSNGSVEIIKLLLKHPNIDVNRENAAQYTALYHSIAFGRVEVVNMLLAHPNIDVNKADRFGESYLFFCCSNRSWEIAKLLIKHPDIDVNSASLMTSQTSLMIACEYDDLPTVKCLMDHPKINPDLVDAFGRSARDYIVIPSTNAVPISILVRSGGGLTSKDMKKKDDCIAS